MIALNTIADQRPAELYQHLSTILDAADKGSVITKDGAVGILTKLSGHKKYGTAAFALLLDQMMKCPPNQFSMNAENAVPVVTPDRKAAFKEVLNARLADLPKESQQKRIGKVLKKISTVAG